MKDHEIRIATTPSGKDYLYVPTIYERSSMISCEYEIGINIETGTIFGNYIGSDGWLDLEPDEVIKIAEEHGFYDALCAKREELAANPDLIEGMVIEQRSRDEAQILASRFPNLADHLSTNEDHGYKSISALQDALIKSGMSEAEVETELEEMNRGYGAERATTEYAQEAGRIGKYEETFAYQKNIKPALDPKSDITQAKESIRASAPSQSAPTRTQLR